MDEKNLNDQQPEENLLAEPDVAEEILPDEEAMAQAGLTHPEEAGPEMPAEEFRDEEYREAFGEGEELERVFSDEPYEPAQSEEPPVEESEPEAPAEELNLRKGRPKRKKGYGLLGIPHILATVVWLAIIVAIGVSLGRVAWVCIADVLGFGREVPVVEETISTDESQDGEELEPGTVVITINDEDTLDDIALKLQEVGAIKYPELFKLYATLTDAREKISSGSFTLYTTYDYMALVNSMTYYSSARKVVQVMIPEGYTCSQMFALLEEKGVCSAANLEEYAANGELDEYLFLEGVERGDKYCLEGYLFPDTYDFYIGDDAERVLEKMLNNFEKRFSEDMQAGLDTLNETLAAMMSANGYGADYIAEHKMTIREVTIVASLIEKETAGNEESYSIASVIYNRLTNQKEYPYLNIDAALLYAIGHKEVITNDDKQTDTPYNTYLYAGLIPGPICNPGLNSLRAAVNPEKTGYYFYALDPETGEHHFTSTYAEHQAFLDSLGG